MAFFEESDWGWLQQKMLAVCPVLSRDKLDIHLVVLARLCLEEQLVDRDDSTGRRGKYRSRYHPRESISDELNDGNRKGTRPLTTGELTANWKDMEEVLLTKYGVNEEMEEHIRDLVLKHSLVLPSLSPPSLSSSQTIRSITASPCYVYVHCPVGFQTLGSPVMDTLLSQCDVVDGGGLGDAMEYMVSDVLGEEGADASISYHCFSRDISELEGVVKDDRTFPSKFWFVCNSRLEPEKAMAYSNPFVTQVDHKFVQDFLLSEGE